MSRILLGVSGGIAAYKALEFVRLATADGHSVRVVQTPASIRFVGRGLLRRAHRRARPDAASSSATPHAGAFPDQRPPAHDPLSHLELVANADVYLIAPACANTIAKLAAGLADNLLTSCALAADCPVVLAPAMNSRMYEHPATQANLQTLRGRGVHRRARSRAPRIQGGEGHRAPGRAGATARRREASPPRPGADRTQGGRGALGGVSVLVTAGGTREPIDSVRYVGNSSSGRMGFALAQAAARDAAPTSRSSPRTSRSRARPAQPPRRRQTAAELRAACERSSPPATCC